MLSTSTLSSLSVAAKKPKHSLHPVQLAVSTSASHPPLRQTHSTASTSATTTIAYRSRATNRTTTMVDIQVHIQPQPRPATQKCTNITYTSTSSNNRPHLALPSSALQAPLPRPVSVPAPMSVPMALHPLESQHTLIHGSALRRPIPNSYWATPFLVACEYPWAPSTPRPKLDALLAAGVRTFIDLTESGELIAYSELLPVRAANCGLSPSDVHTLQYFRFPIPDRKCPPSPSPSSSPYSSRSPSPYPTSNSQRAKAGLRRAHRHNPFLSKIFHVLHTCEAQGRIAAIHCRGGIGRTGTIVGCWLVQSGRAKNGDEALQMIASFWEGVEKRQRFPVSPETGDQMEFVRKFEKVVCEEDEDDK